MSRYERLSGQDYLRLISEKMSSGTATEEDIINFLFTMQGGRCAWCKNPLDPNGRHITVNQDELEDEEDRWQYHHHPEKSRRENYLPEMPINMRLLCLKCHGYPHGRYREIRYIDPLL